jgi:uncharacterized tellurite resistance protein B-like protein
MKTLDEKSIIGVAALLIHAARIDEQYSNHEKVLIKEFIESYLKNGNKDEVLRKAEEMEHNSNQLLNFTNLIKKNTTKVKSNIIEHLWKIIISDNTIDQYESNLMRRVCGLIYFPDKMCAEIKLRLLNNK